MAAITSIQQFLSTVLSQRGPNALPYHEPTKLLIRNHLLTLIQSYPSLHLSVSVFTHNDGRSSNLLHCHGTVPITFRGSTYNIPVSIWLLDSYPHQPPYVLLTPTPNMSVQPNHPYVDRDCSVHVPYLRSWIYPSSNLLDLVKSMCQLFGQDPPLYSNPNPSPTPSPSPNPNLSPTPSPIPSPSPGPKIYSSFSGSQYGGGRIERPPVPARPSGMVGMDDPAEVYRRNAINKILENVHGDLAMLRKNQEAEMENMFSTQAVLRQREQEILKGMREMVEEKEALEQQLQIVMMNSDVLEGWVKENEGRKVQDAVQVDEVFETVDVGSKQLLECTAADLAVEDTVYSLDKAVQEGVISFEAYLKSVRVLSREQFVHRALAAKVKAAQVQAQVQSMAARVPSQYAS